MANFPLVLAIAPGLLSYASANGFTMDHKVRTSNVRCPPFEVEMSSPLVPRFRIPQDV